MLRRRELVYIRPDLGYDLLSGSAANARDDVHEFQLLLKRAQARFNLPIQHGDLLVQELSVPELSCHDHPLAGTDEAVKRLLKLLNLLPGSAFGKFSQKLWVGNVVDDCLDHGAARNPAMLLSTAESLMLQPSKTFYKRLTSRARSPIRLRQYLTSSPSSRCCLLGM